MKIISITQLVSLIFQIKFGVCQIIAGSKDNNIYYYNSSSTVTSLFSNGHTGQVNCLKLLDNSTYASGSNDHNVIIWNAKTGAQIKTLTGHTNNVLCLELLGNGYLASGGQDNNIFIWNYTSTSTTYSYALTNAHGNNQQVNCIRQLSGYYFASATNGASNNLRIWDYRTFTAVGYLSGHTDNVLALEMLSSGYLVSVSKDTTLQFWDFTTLTRVAYRAGYGQTIPCIKEVKPNVIAFGDAFTTGSNLHTIYFWGVSNIVVGANVLNQVSYTEGPIQTCFDMKMYGTNNLVIANNNQQTVDVWTVDSYTHSTLNVAPTGAGKEILCIEPLNGTVEYGISQTTTTTSTTTTTTTTTKTTTTTSTTTTTTTTTKTTTTTTTTTTSTTSTTTTSTSTTTTSISTTSTATTTSSTTTMTTTSASNLTINAVLLTQEFSLSSLTTQEVVSILNSDYDFSNCIVNCSSNGVCKYTGNKTFSCECMADYAGQTCQQNIRPCFHSPCLNNGTCIENSTSSSSSTNQTYTCECGQFYYGTNCEYKIDVCANETCSGNGNCADLNDVATCTCFSLYSGTHCEIVSSQRKTIETISSTTSVIAIVTLVLFYCMFILSDLMDWLCISKGKPRERQVKIKKPKKLVYIP